MNEQTPFGFHYSGSSVSIKLRLHPVKFKAMNINDNLGKWRFTKNGYVLFETTLDTQSSEYQQLTTKLNSHK